METMISKIYATPMIMVLVTALIFTILIPTDIFVDLSATDGEGIGKWSGTVEGIERIPSPELTQVVMEATNATARDAMWALTETKNDLGRAVKLLNDRQHRFFPK